MISCIETPADAVAVPLDFPYYLGTLRAYS